MSLDNRVHFVAGLTMPRPKNTELRVYVVEYGREELMLRIKYPDGRVEHESSGSADRIEANRYYDINQKGRQVLAAIKTYYQNLWPQEHI